MESFTLWAHLSTPIIKRGFVTLDALLMSVLGTGDVGHLLMVEDGLYYASAGMPYRLGQQQKASFVASMRPEHTLEWLEVIKPNTKNQDVQIGLARQREAGNVINGYLATVTPYIEWYATGHADQVLEVLKDVAFIGKRRTAGYGEISRWEAEPGDLDGLSGYLNEPLRPIPAGRCVHGGDWVPVEAAWCAPYWYVKNRTKCYVPEDLQ